MAVIVHGWVYLYDITKCINWWRFHCLAQWKRGKSSLWNWWRFHCLAQRKHGDSSVWKMVGQSANRMELVQKLLKYSLHVLAIQEMYIANFILCYWERILISITNEKINENNFIHDHIEPNRERGCWHEFWHEEMCSGDFYMVILVFEREY